MKRVLTVSLIALALPLVLAVSAHADRFVAVPELDGKAQPLEIRVVAYDGSTNGQMVVEVVNKSSTTQQFKAEGIYFVPKGDPEKAPQRLGAAGPMLEVARKGGTKHQDAIAMKPGEKKQLRLEVFCIDSHRASPSSKTKFTVGTERLPKELRSKLDRGNKEILRKNAGDVAKSKSEIQQHMWKTRDADWIQLDGERKQEKSAPTPRPPRQESQRK